MPRMVRRKPWAERVKAMLNPMDFLLWVSEELETRDWDSKALGTKLGLAFNFIFLIARANCAASEAHDDVFSDGVSSRLTNYVIRPLSWILVLLSGANAFYTVTRSRHYRLFEVNVEQAPQTPSAHRVKVQSSPVASSPLRFLSNLIVPETAESRAHPDKTRDVWELAVWDPLPVSLQLFSLFSPGHVLVYMLFLPLENLDPRPSVTVFNCLALQVILSVQMLLLQSRFSHPNPNYMRHVDPEHTPARPHRNVQHSAVASRLFTPSSQARRSGSFTPVPSTRSPSRQSLPAGVSAAATPSASTTKGTQYGGNLGVFSHAKSPLKKASSLYDLSTDYARKPWAERVKAMLNPMDFLLWVSEELETRDWDSKALGTKLGLAFNFIFLIARANCAASEAHDDVFSDGVSSRLTNYMIRPLSWILVLLSGANAFYTMTRSRHYRLFEVNVEQAPQTPSAHRVKVQSSPVASSPLRFLSNLIVPETAESRAHPDKTRDVWELAVWDPLPVSLQLFSLFSPGHVLVYMLFLPLENLDPRPSVTVFNCLALQVILSVQMLFLQSRFSQQIKDTAIIHKEVLHEYDTKFVHPRLHPLVRDVGTQASFEEEDEEDGEGDFVELGTPTTVIKKEFQTHPNPNYMRHVDPEHTPARPHRNVQHSAVASRLFTPSSQARRSGSFTPIPSTRSPSRQSLPAGVSAAATPSASTTTGTQYGGNLGVFSHAKSPLKKASSLYDLSTDYASPRNSREMAALEQRRASPVKDNRRLTTANDGDETPINPFAQTQKNRFSQERYPKMWAR
ncbi:hypothetical protein BN1708_006073 [Verticillium longisporum]|uniref:DUF2418 domain-containing protein n=1 Tax=Verticillium longisporum TaxID=100787 RepID=A0A0G4MH42_VERLO|nr:hypothetical protein BN1708_006073 [Verticillium longisporum]